LGVLLLVLLGVLLILLRMLLILLLVLRILHMVVHLWLYANQVCAFSVYDFLFLLDRIAGAAAAGAEAVGASYSVQPRRVRMDAR
jgi:hypothetical protein